MSVPPRRHAMIMVAFAVGVTVSIAHGQVYKCTDKTGKTTYSDTPCDSAGRSLKLPSDPALSTTNPNVCAQLLDETRRLAADDRDGKRGRTESASTAQRRQSLTRQYEARCAGIARSELEPN
jgi:hypothetical protein